MNLEVEATYENGTLKLDQELPLANGQRVRLTVHKPGGRAKASAGVFQWRGSQQDLDYLILSENNDPLEAP
jgi:predicted DNA-binding antitoxin AbrB/MazE fold protein